MGPSIFDLCASDSSLIALLGSNPFRMFPAGEAPQDTAKPYIVWNVAGGSPVNYIACPPDMDFFTIELDVYAPTLSEARSVARALRSAIEGRCTVRSFGEEGRDVDTRLYSVALDVDWFEAV